MLEGLEQADTRRDVRQAVDALPERQREVICMHYWDSLTFVEIAQRIGGKVQPDKDKAMRTLRRDKVLRKYYMPDFLHWGRSTFSSTWTSATEMAVLWRERHNHTGDGPHQLGRSDT